MKNEDKKTPALKLPERLVTSVDLSRVYRELKLLDDWLVQAQLRTGGQNLTPPKTSATLEDLAAINGISLLEPAERQVLIGDLAVFSVKAPKIHMSFAVEPSTVFLSRMILWLRANINPVILLEVGLQPTLAAGCTVRTTNKVFDLSLRNRFTESRPLLIDSIAKIQGITPEAPAPQTPEEQVTGETTPQTEAQSAPPVPPVTSTNAPEARPAPVDVPAETPSTVLPEQSQAPATAVVPTSESSQATPTAKVEAKQ